MNKAIKKIELDLGGKTVTLTPEQAKNLKDALDDLFGKEIIVKKEYIHDSFPVPYPVPYREPLRPYWEPVPYWDWRRDVPYYTTTSGNGISFNSVSNTLRLTG